MTARPLYQRYLLKSYPDIEALNKEWGSSYQLLLGSPLPLDAARPAPPADKWEQFVRKQMPLRYVRLDVDAAQPAWAAMMRGRYRDVASYNLEMGGSSASLDEARRERVRAGRPRAVRRLAALHRNRLPSRSDTPRHARPALRAASRIEIQGRRRRQLRLRNGLRVLRGFRAAVPGGGLLGPHDPQGRDHEALPDAQLHLRHQGASSSRGVPSSIPSFS